jgi:hypothetical protein
MPPRTSKKNAGPPLNLDGAPQADSLRIDSAEFDKAMRSALAVPAPTKGGSKKSKKGEADEK